MGQSNTCAVYTIPSFLLGQTAQCATTHYLVDSIRTSFSFKVLGGTLTIMKIGVANELQKGIFTRPSPWQTMTRDCGLCPQASVELISRTACKALSFKTLVYNAVTLDDSMRHPSSAVVSVNFCKRAPVLGRCESTNVSVYVHLCC